MEQNLIEKLWNHTYKSDAVASTSPNYPPFHVIFEQLKRNSPILLPASNFFLDSSTNLFMSFHNEKANTMKHFHDFFELNYVCKGNPIGVINEQEIPFQEGSLCIMNPNAVHYFKKYTLSTDLVLNIVLPKDLFHKSIFRILFTDPILNAFFIRYRIDNESHPSFLHLPQGDGAIDFFIETLATEYLNKKEYSHVIMESLLTLIFSFSLRTYKKKFSHSNSSMAKIIDYIYLNYQTVHMESVASKFHYHPKYLSALIHKETGQTFRDLLVQIKLQNAVNYLLYTDYTVEQIADLIGYKDKSSFYNLFKKTYQMSPAQYRKKQV